MREMPRDRVLTETDGPFATIKNAPATPLDIRQTVSGLAQIWNVSEDETQRTIAANFARAEAE